MHLSPGYSLVRLLEEYGVREKNQEDFGLPIHDIRQRNIIVLK